MSATTKLRSPVCEPRAILGPGGNRVRVSDEPPKQRKTEPSPKKPQTTTTTKTRKAISEVPQSVVRSNGSVDSACSSDSSSSGSLAKAAAPRKKTVKSKGQTPAKAITNGGEAVAVACSPEFSRLVKRCDWITSNSDPEYISFHDKEWGVRVHEDKSLFELLVFSQALAELTWPAILNKRDIFRKLFDNFDPSSVAQFNEKKLLSLKVNGNLVLSEPKLRAIVENAKQILKIQQESGSFSNYCWSFTSHKPIKNAFRYGRQVPVKSPKADLISKDMMQRGFRCVGPTVIYSFMQVSGIVNDHLVGCFRHQQCDTAHVEASTPVETTGKEDPGERLSKALLEEEESLSPSD